MPAIKPDPMATLSAEDLDELLSDSDYLDSDQEDIKLPSSSGGRKEGKLQPPRTTTYSAKHLHEMMHSGQIELNPDYQRDVVWRRDKQITLIQSLFMNYPVPQVLFSCTEISEDEGDTMTCIDGKQRLTSIRRFMDGEIPFKPIGTSQSFYYTQAGDDEGSRRKTSKTLLPASYRRAFEQMQITCVEYRGLQKEQERDIFQRVQLGISLTAAEKLQAIAGPWADFGQEILKKYVMGDGCLQQFINLDFTRARPFSALISAIMVCFAMPENKLSPTAQSMTAFTKRTDEPPAKFRKRFSKACALFVEIATNHHDAAFETVAAGKVAPVEFSFILVLLYYLLPQYESATQFLVKKVSELRRHIRGNHVDVRANTKVHKDLHSWIASIPVKKSRKRAMSSEDEDYSAPGHVGDRSTPTVATRNKVKKSKAKDQARESREDSLSSPPPEETTPGQDPPPVQTASIQFQQREPNAALPVQQHDGYTGQQGHAQGGLPPTPHSAYPPQQPQVYQVPPQGYQLQPQQSQYMAQPQHQSRSAAAAEFGQFRASPHPQQQQQQQQQQHSGFGQPIMRGFNPPPHGQSHQ